MMLGTAVLVPLVVASLEVVRDRPRTKEVAPPVRVVACPQVRITSTEEAHSGWLAAAAATLACDRIRLRLGGKQEAALEPAALVPERSPAAVFEEKDAAARQRVVANSRADAIVEGELDQGRDFQVTLRLVDRIGNEIGKGNGAHVSLVGAIRIASDMMSDEAGLSPAPGSLDRTFPGASLDAILATHDLSVHALSGDAEELDDACTAVVPRTDLGALATIVKDVCDPWGGRPDHPAPIVEAKLRGLFFAARARGDALWLPWERLTTIRHSQADASPD